MRIITKKGSALEQTVKVMCERITESVVGGQDLVKTATGIRPINIYGIYHWGTISKLVPEFVFNDADIGRLNSKQLRRKKGTRDVWVPALRYKEGKQLDLNFRKYSDKYEVRDEPLRTFGINTVNWTAGVSYYCKPVHDAVTDRYILVCSDSIPEAFSRERLAKDQFEIEY